MCDFIDHDRTKVKEVSAVPPTILWTKTTRCTVDALQKPDRLLIVSSYTIKVLMLTAIQIVVTSVIVIILSVNYLQEMFRNSKVQLLVAGLFA
ncbi:unnamed protein product, partial [Schistosoma turkestanicum]